MHQLFRFSSIALIGVHFPYINVFLETVQKAKSQGVKRPISNRHSQLYHTVVMLIFC